jgi:hypothetical protein
MESKKGWELAKPHAERGEKEAGVKCSHCGGAHKSEEHKKHETKKVAKEHEAKGEKKAMEHKKVAKEHESKAAKAEPHKEHVKAGKAAGREMRRKKEEGHKVIHVHGGTHHHYHNK